MFSECKLHMKSMITSKTTFWKYFIFKHLLQRNNHYHQQKHCCCLSVRCKWKEDVKFTVRIYMKITEVIFEALSSTWDTKGITPFVKLKCKYQDFPSLITFCIFTEKLPHFLSFYFVLGSIFLHTEDDQFCYTGRIGNEQPGLIHLFHNWPIRNMINSQNKIKYISCP